MEKAWNSSWSKAFNIICETWWSGVMTRYGFSLSYWCLVMMWQKTDAAGRILKCIGIYTISGDVTSPEFWVRFIAILFWYCLWSVFLVVLPGNVASVICPGSWLGPGTPPTRQRLQLAGFFKKPSFGSVLSPCSCCWFGVYAVWGSLWHLDKFSNIFWYLHLIIVLNCFCVLVNC